MQRLRILLLIPMVLVELVLLALCWIVAIIHKPTAWRLTEWSIENLPAKDWYMGEQRDE